MRRLYPYVLRLFVRQTAEVSVLVDAQRLATLIEQPFDVERLSAGLPNETFLAAHP